MASPAAYVEAVPQIQSLAGEFPCAMDATIKKEKGKKKRRTIKVSVITSGDSMGKMPPILREIFKAILFLW